MLSLELQDSIHIGPWLVNRNVTYKNVVEVVNCSEQEFEAEASSTRKAVHIKYYSERDK